MQYISVMGPERKKLREPAVKFTISQKTLIIYPKMFALWYIIISFFSEIRNFSKFTFRQISIYWNAIPGFPSFWSHDLSYLRPTRFGHLVVRGPVGGGSQSVNNNMRLRPSSRGVWWVSRHADHQSKYPERPSWAITSFKKSCLEFLNHNSVII